MSLPAYPDYKESKIDWIGPIPADWDVKRLVHTSYIKGRVGWKGLSSSEYKESGYAFLVTGTDFESRYINWRTCHFVDRERFEDDPYIQLENGDLLITKDGSIGKLAIVNGLDRPACLNSGIFLVRSHGTYCTDYLYWVLSSNVFTVFCDIVSQGSTIQHLYQNVFEDFSFPVPKLEEQRAIVAFLDRETAKIDALVAEQERLIALLKEKRQAVISHAVTKGLDPSAPMKDSGVEWLGKVPAHWEITRIKHLATGIEQGWSPQCDADPVEGPEEWGVLKVGCVNGGVFKPFENKRLPVGLEAKLELAVREGDLLVSRANTKELVGSAAVAKADYPRLMISDKLYRIKLDRLRCTPSYLGLLLNTREVRGCVELEATGASSSMQNISQDVVLEIDVPLPSIEEQGEIVAGVGFELARLDRLASEAGVATDLLVERRAALISAAVTGQIDVRGLAEVAA